MPACRRAPESLRPPTTRRATAPPGNQDPRPGATMRLAPLVARVSRCTLLGKAPGTTGKTRPRSRPCRDWPDYLAVDAGRRHSPHRAPVSCATELGGLVGVVCRPRSLDAPRRRNARPGSPRHLLQPREGAPPRDPPHANSAGDSWEDLFTQTHQSRRPVAEAACHGPDYLETIQHGAPPGSGARRRSAGSPAPGARPPPPAPYVEILTERGLMRVEAPPYATYDLRHQAPVRRPLGAARRPEP